MLRSLLLLALCYGVFPIYGKVYDCFTFFNEFEVLEIRLNELYDYVDKFIIVEASTSHRGLPKSFGFESRKDMYKKFADKIVYIKIFEKNELADDGTYLGSAWERENYQKNQVMRGLRNCSPDDLILFSDVDEIPPGKMIPEIVEIIKKRPIVAFNQSFYRHCINRQVPDNEGKPSKWIGSLAIRYDHLTDIPGRTPNQRRMGICFQGIREIDNYPEGVLVVDGGWHFSSSGGFQRFQDKCYNWVHWTNSYPTTYSDWLWEVRLHPLQTIDDTYPQFVRDNIEYLSKCGLIDPGSS